MRAVRGPAASWRCALAGPRALTVGIRGRTPAPAGARSGVRAAPLPNATAWPQDRGTAQQLGIASGKLASRLKLVWKFKTGGRVTSSPVVAGGRVFIGSGDGQVYALRLDNGEKVWSFKTGDEVEAPPCVIGEEVVVGSSDGQLYSLDASTGKPRWKYKTEDKILGAATWAPAPGGKGQWVVVGSYDNRVHCVDAATGKPVWAVRDRQLRQRDAGHQRRQGDLRRLRRRRSTCSGWRMASRSRPSRSRTISPASAAVDGWYAYIGHYGDEFLCADLATPAKIAWRYRTGSSPTSPPRR